MGLISIEVEIKIGSSNYKHYEELGYKIPKKIGAKGKIVNDFNKTIVVKTKDLTKGCNAYVDVKCDCCSKIYKMTYNNYNKIKHDENKIYCYECAGKVLNSGENHHAWNPNITDEERLIKRNYKEYTTFVKTVMKRDNYTCQVCGKQVSDGLEVHHLDGYNWCKEKRLDETNSITLCFNCHKNFHLRYGSGNNTKEQFLEWLNITQLELKRYDGKLPINRRIIRLDDRKIYESFNEASKDVNSKSKTKICSCCNYFKNPNLKHTERNAYGYTYMWLDEYNDLTEEEIMSYYNECLKHRRKVKDLICITTGMYFKTSGEANIWYGRDRHSSKITECCKGELSYSGIKYGKKLKWMYYDEYSKLVNNEYIGNFVI